ncbi:MAG: pilus assembly protein N-terminal domain-containing protein [Gemmatimonadota bacterium]
MFSPNTAFNVRLSTAILASSMLALSLAPATLVAQVPASSSVLVRAGLDVQRIELVAGRSLPITDPSPINKVTVANPLIADVVVISETEVVVNAILAGETDIILWGPNVPRRHYRVIVRSSPERRQILVAIKFAEVRRDALREISTSLRALDRERTTRAGTGAFNTDAAIDSLGRVTLPGSARFLTILSTFNTRDLLGLLDLQETRGNARFLAEPNVMAANREEASFLAGGELPIPIVQGGGGGATGGSNVTIQYREFGVRLAFTGEVLTDSLLKLKLRPEVSSLDFANAILLQGFRVPAFRTRKVETTVDVLAGRSLIISGLFNEEREQVSTGIPFLVNIPFIGKLFASNRWNRNETELIVVVTPVLMDPNNPRSADLLDFRRDIPVPAREMLEKRMWPSDSVAAPRKP